MKRKLIELIPFFIMAAASIITVCVYLLAMNGREVFLTVRVAIAPLIVLIVPFLNRIFKTRIPFAFNVALFLFVLLSMNIAPIYLYGLVPHMDKVSHTLFGAVCAFGIFIFLLHCGGEKLKSPCFFAVIILCVAGIAALWEIYQFTAGVIRGADLQHWMPDISAVGEMTVKEFFKNYNPLTDTVLDMTVALLGCLLFFGFVFADKLCGYKALKNMCLNMITKNKRDTSSTAN